MKKAKREQIWNKYDKRCAYCGCELEYKDMQVDHIESKQWHIRHKIEGVDRMSNLNPSCKQCNFYKSDGSLSLFRSQLSTINERLNKIFIVRLAISFGILKYKEFDNKFYFEK
jgi:hypothetical protein